MTNPNAIGIGVPNPDFTGFKEHRAMTNEVMRAVVGFIGVGKYVQVKQGGVPKYQVTVTEINPEPEPEASKLIIPKPHEGKIITGLN